MSISSIIDFPDMTQGMVLEPEEELELDPERAKFPDHHPSPYLHPGFPELSAYDVSTHPSYTHLVLPYHVICRQRYAQNHIKYCKLFASEIIMIGRIKALALDGVRIERIFSKGILRPKTKTKAQIARAIPDKLTPAERWYLEDHIMDTTRN